MTLERAASVLFRFGSSPRAGAFVMAAHFFLRGCRSVFCSTTALAMNTGGKIRQNPFGTSWIVMSLLLIAGSFCGCSTVQPELTAEERVYNQQLKEQGNANGPSPTDDLTVPQKIGYYAEWPVMFVLEALAGSHYSFSP
jgi:hypothetical protein